jgi:hypothetical protein
MYRIACAIALLYADLAVADPPRLVIPVEVKAVGDYVRVSPDTTAKSVVYVGQSGVGSFPNELLADKRVFVLPVRGLPEGRYAFTAVGTLNDEQAVAEFVVVVGPGVVVKPPDKPVDPPPPAKSSVYFMIVRPEGPAAPAFTEVMNLSAWKTLRDAGYTYKDFSPAEAARFGVSLPNGTVLPVVVTLKTSPTGSKIARPAIPLPTTDDAVTRLPEGLQ